MIIHVLNGPNLGRLGTRAPDTYGRETLADVEQMCRRAAQAAGAEIVFRQTDREIELVEWVREAGAEAKALVINPAALTHWSLALGEAVASCGIPVVEVHISNIYAREAWRARSVVSPAAAGTISGLGVKGYVLAIEWITSKGE